MTWNAAARFGAGSGGEPFLSAAVMPAGGPRASRGAVSVPGSPRSNLALDGVRVLVVEDDPDARELVSAILEDAGALVQSAESAASGFDAVRAFQPQLLVSDIGMPEEDGYSLIRRVRALGVEEGGGIPSVALTAYTRAEDRAKALGAGFTAHMAKPVNPSDLVSTLERLAGSTSN